MAEWSLEGLSPELRAAMEFLQSTLPVSDLDCYPYDLFLSCARHALRVREEFPWCAGLEEELFYHYVLCPRVNDEDLSEHRALFYGQLRPLVAGLPVEEAVLAVNRWCHEWASYQFQDDRTASPLTVFRCGSGRCGEESAFLTAALRSVGIAARQVYAPRWSHCDDNHAWVEALCGGTWRFLGACEPEPVLDRGWFNTAASRAMVVHSRTFGQGASPLHGEVLGTGGAVTWYNQTPRYAETARYTFRATRGGRPAPGALFQLQVLNEASYHTVAALTADENGQAGAALGLGDLHVRASLGDWEAEGDCAGRSLTLALSAPADPAGDWVELDFRAPGDTPKNPGLLTPEQKARRAGILSAGTGLRTRRIADCYDEVRAALLPGREDLLREARGNFDEIFTFLSGKGPLSREALARTLSPKDLRDTPAQVLEDHLVHTPRRGSSIPEDVYRDFVLCPRVALEKLTAWRGLLAARLDKANKIWYSVYCRQLWDALRALVRPETGRVYENLYWPPAAALEAGRCDEKSLRVLFVAQLRAMGVPARLRPLDGMPEFYGQDGAFHPLGEEPAAHLILTREEGESPLYRQNWSLSRKTASGWSLLSLSDGAWQGSVFILTLSPGTYRLLTSVRLPNGNQFAARRDLVFTPGKVHTVPLRLRAFALEDLLGSQDMPPLPAVTLDGTPIPDAAHHGGRPALLFWMEEGGEPTEHVLNELAAARAALEALPVDVRFFLRGSSSLSQPTLAGVLRDWPAVRVLLDDWAFDLETVARHLACDPDRPPLAVACDAAGRAVYAVSGYHVGSVELLTRIAAHLCAPRGA